MTVMQEAMKAAMEAKNNDLNSYVWKMARNKDGVQEEIRLVDATPEQLQKFYDHCQSMLYSTDKLNPGRYTLLKIIEEQRRKCNTALFINKLESGSLSRDGKPYPRFLYLQDINAYMDQNKEYFPVEERREISISALPGNLPREFERISISEAIDGCLGQLGTIDTKHITFSFILSLGVHLTPEELKEFDVKDQNGKPKKKPELIKERLGINPEVKLNITPNGLSFAELRAMVNLRPKNYSDLTTDQLTTLRNKVLFKLEEEVKKHAQDWEERKKQILKVAENRDIVIDREKDVTV